MRSARHIRVSGIVQGVGFRPFVWRLAQELQLDGWVRNDPLGVEIAAEGSDTQLASLLARLRQEAPPRARVDALRADVIAPRGLAGFHIATSATGDTCGTSIGPDTAVCESCLTELFDPGNRRWRHALISCTHCGPRYTIAAALPYDRAHTSMRPFALCAHCAREYADPHDRRFHAEIIACPDCGPQPRLLDAGAAALPGDPIAAALAQLRAGAIVAIKGLGGYHLACDARNAQAVARLRARKAREAKPFALLAAGEAALRGVVSLDEPARALLHSPERPIVLVPRAPGSADALPGVADGLAQLGVMLPATPLQWLLFHEAAGRPAGLAWREQLPLLLVMTSANPGGEPLVIDDQEALQRLRGIADAFLLHGRTIVIRCDDSVISATAPPALVRRARGHTPVPLALPWAGPPVLALGAHLKSTTCVTRGGQAFVSQHIGDLDNAASRDFLERSAAHLCRLLQVEPQLIAHDLHPELASTHLAARLAAAHGARLVGVQHHHAHVAAVAAEHGWQAPLLGLVLDGTGHGTDGGAWGGELLAVDGARFRRLGHLATLPLPGGDRAAREPWRMGAAVLHQLGRGAEIATRFAAQPAARQLDTLLVRRLHAPPTSSAGRLFDAAAALLGICAMNRYEAEAAMRLEALAQSQPLAPAPGLWQMHDGVLDLLPLLAALADWRADAAAGAALFHATLIAALSEWTLAAAQRSGLRTVALAGGCFLNNLLRAQLAPRLEAAGLAVLMARQLPPSDGAISVGQAWVASAALATGGD